MRAIVLAGGQDDGLGPLTLDIPGAALPVVGRPLVARTLDYLAAHGVTDATVSSYRWPHLTEHAVEQHVDGIRATTALESPPFGSANVVRQLGVHLDSRFVVVMGTVLTDLDLRAVLQQHVQTGALATVMVAEVDPPCLFGEVATDRDCAVVMVGSEQLVRRSGRRTANTGIYVLEPEVLECIPRDRPFDLASDLLPELVGQEKLVYASLQAGFWCALSSHEQYRAANVAVLKGGVRGMQPQGVELTQNVWVAKSASIDPRAILVPPVLVGERCRIEKDAVIGPDAILGADVWVKRGATVRRSVVLQGSKVGLATKLDDAVVRGNMLVRAASSAPTYVSDRQVLEPLEQPNVELALRSVLDRVLALVALLVLAPIMLLTALLIKLDSSGPVFYSQLRVGQGKRTAGGQYQGRVFELLKFRTMFQDADQRLEDVLAANEYGSAPFVKIKNDPRITRVGRFLRATSLDELPQLINVVRGEMGLVGNRPLPLYEAEQLGDEWQRIRFNAPAGITGLWQISGRSDLSAEERIILDNYYALTRSLWSDLKILLLTIPVLLARRGAR